VEILHAVVQRETVFGAAVEIDRRLARLELGYECRRVVRLPRRDVLAVDPADPRADLARRRAPDLDVVEQLLLALLVLMPPGIQQRVDAGVTRRRREQVGMAHR